MAEATLLISSKNYSSWSLRGYLLAKLSGIDFVEEPVSPDDPRMKEELLMRTSSILVPCLIHGTVTVWDTLAIAEYLNELFPEANMLPKEKKARAHCRSISGEMHSGFANLRAALPMNLKARHPGFKVWAGAQSDVGRITEIWREQLAASGGPFLFGDLTMADAMYAPVCTRFATYDVTLDPVCAAYRDRILALPVMREWTAAAALEPDEVEELDVEF